jgi:VIT1/CCC1 family predicted Fe2+/Mn2+ transporter
MSDGSPVPSAARATARNRRAAPHPSEPHAAGLAGRLNWLRAGVLGANDGIVSVAGLVIGVAGATTARGPIFTAGLAGVVAGAVSMALGEYVSVSSQRDSETAQLAQERRELATTPDRELAELTAIYAAKGLSAGTAREVAVELTTHDALAAFGCGAAPGSGGSGQSGPRIGRLGAGVRPRCPAAAAGHLAAAQTGGRVPVTFVVVLVALAIAGGVSARIGGSDPRRAVVRVAVGGGAGLGLTYGIGHLFGTAVG